MISVAFVFSAPQARNLATIACANMEPLADPRSRSTLGARNLQHRSVRIQNWGFYFGNLPQSVGIKVCSIWDLPRSGGTSSVSDLFRSVLLLLLRERTGAKVAVVTVKNHVSIFLPRCKR